VIALLLSLADYSCLSQYNRDVFDEDDFEIAAGAAPVGERIE
jgi:hypothetical protein